MHAFMQNYYSDLLIRLPSRCLNRQGDGRRGPRPGWAGGDRGRPRIRSLRSRFDWSQHLWRPRQPGRHLRVGRRRPDHHPHRNILLDRSALGRHRRFFLALRRHRRFGKSNY